MVVALCSMRYVGRQSIKINRRLEFKYSLSDIGQPHHKTESNHNSTTPRSSKWESSSSKEPDHTFNRKVSQKQPCAKRYRINRVHIVSYQDLVLDSQNTSQLKPALLLEASGRWWMLKGYNN